MIPSSPPLTQIARETERKVEYCVTHAQVDSEVLQAQVTELIAEACQSALASFKQALKEQIVEWRAAHEVASGDFYYSGELKDCADDVDDLLAIWTAAETQEKL